MTSNNMTNGLLFTADPYSKVVDPADKNTSLLFGDAATATWISSDYKYKCRNFSFGTIGKSYENLIVKNKILHMDGRGIFNFAAKCVPKDIEQLLQSAEMTMDEVDLFLVHQGSRFIVDTIRKRLGVSPEKVPFDISEYGNTVSSSIPILLEKWGGNNRRIVASGFGVGLSWASCLIECKGD